MPTTLLLETSPLLSLKWKHSLPLNRTQPPQTTNLNFTTKPNKFTQITVAKTQQVSPDNNNNIRCLSKPQKTALEILADTIRNALKPLRKPAIAAVLVGLLLMYDLNSAALAASSGGRMGGRSFSAQSSSSSSLRSSYSAPSAATGGFSFSAPYYSPSPFGGGFYVGPAVGVGVGAGSSFVLILVGFAAFVLVSGFLSDRSQGSLLTATDTTTVLKLQV